MTVFYDKHKVILVERPSKEIIKTLDKQATQNAVNALKDASEFLLITVYSNGIGGKTVSNVKGLQGIKTIFTIFQDWFEHCFKTLRRKL